MSAAERALEIAAGITGQDRARSRTRVLAATSMVFALKRTRAAAAQECGIGHPNQLAPSQWLKAGLTEADVTLASQRLAVACGEAEPAGADRPTKKERRAPRQSRPRPERNGISRFAAAKVEVERTVGLAADHPAVVEGRTLFPSTVVGTTGSPRFLVSGQNNPKLGRQITKGEREGWPIYHLTLEERATCPRSCPVWRDCYGNAMHYARRHRPDDAFLPSLRAELQTLSRAHPKGLLIRLHTLGDFYSVPYVLFWAQALADFPNVHVFGFTARSVDDTDPASVKIAQAIGMLTTAFWSRFAIRTSKSPAGPVMWDATQASIVVDADPERADVVMCPAQTEKTAACATCGLCWAEAARGKAIGFLRHGIKRGGGRPRKVAADEPAPQVPEPKLVTPLATPSLAAARAPRRQVPRGSTFAKRSDGVVQIISKPITGDIIRWAREQASLGLPVGDFALLVDVDPVELERRVHLARAA